MDPHIRWLRRFLLGRVLIRTGAEATVVGSGAGIAAAVIGLEPIMAVVLGLLAAQLFAGLRIVAAVLLNPVGHRFLMKWDRAADRLEATDRELPAAPALHRELEVHGLQHLVRIEAGVTLSDLAIGDQPVDGYDIFSSPSRLVLGAVDGDEGMIVTSRLSDGRLLVTTAELVPPHAGLLVNLVDDASPSALLLDHVQRLGTLRSQGRDAVRAGHEAVIDVLDLEWQAWDELGPFLGPLLAVDPRPQPHLLQFRVPAQELRRRSDHHTPATPGPDPGSVDANPGPARSAVSLG